MRGADGPSPPRMQMRRQRAPRRSLAATMQCKTHDALVVSKVRMNANDWAAILEPEPSTATRTAFRNRSAHVLRRSRDLPRRTERAEEQCQMPWQARMRHWPRHRCSKPSSQSVGARAGSRGLTSKRPAKTSAHAAPASRRLALLASSRFGGKNEHNSISRLRPNSPHQAETEMLQALQPVSRGARRKSRPNPSLEARPNGIAPRRCEVHDFIVAAQYRRSRRSSNVRPHSHLLCRVSRLTL